MSILSLDAVCVGYGGKAVIRDVSLDFQDQEIICLLGANGSGKTTLLKAILGLLKTSSGEIRIAGTPQQRWSPKALARRIGYVPQTHNSAFPFTVQEVVLMGRTAHLHWSATPKQRDERIAETCLSQLGIAALRRRDYTQLSGGERQLVMIARALAQEPSLLIMDEPTSSLDFGNQIRVLEHIGRLRDSGMSILLTTHQPEQAARISDRVILLHEGAILAAGPARQVLTVDSLSLVYGLSRKVIASNLTFLDQEARA